MDRFQSMSENYKDLVKFSEVREEGNFTDLPETDCNGEPCKHIYVVKIFFINFKNFY